LNTNFLFYWQKKLLFETIFFDKTFSLTILNIWLMKYLIYKKLIVFTYPAKSILLDRRRVLFLVNKKSHRNKRFSMMRFLTWDFLIKIFYVIDCSCSYYSYSLSMQANRLIVLFGLMSDKNDVITLLNYLIAFLKKRIIRR